MRHSLLITLIAFLVAACFAPARAASGPPYPVGFKQIEFTDGDRHIALAMFYPAEVTDKSATPTGLPFFTSLHQGRRAARGPLQAGDALGRGSNPLQYAWFAETLAGQGYIVVGLYHYRANTYDQTMAYLSNKIWQRPRDISSAIDFCSRTPRGARRSRRIRRRRPFAGRLHLAVDRRRQG